MLAFLKSYNFIDIIFLICCFVVIKIVNIPIFYFYIIVLYLLLILLRFILKSKKENLLITFLTYFFVSIVFIIRSKYFNQNKSVDFYLNTLEHILFSILICFFLYHLLNYFNKKSSIIRLILVVILFNVVGLTNEIFQNFAQKKSLISFDEMLRQSPSINQITRSTWHVLIKRLISSCSWLVVLSFMWVIDDKPTQYMPCMAALNALK